MFWWKSKKEKDKKYTFYVPKDKMEEFVKIYSDFMKFTFTRTFEEKYKFWNFIQTIFKEDLDKIKIAHPNVSFTLSINVEDPCNPKIELINSK